MPMVADSLRTLTHALLLAAMVIAALTFGREILLPLALATVLAFILGPIVRQLTIWRLPRGLSAAISVGVAVLAIVSLSVAFSSQLLTLTGSLAAYKENLVEKVRVVTGSQTKGGALQKAAETVDALEKELKREVSGPAQQGGGVVVTREKSQSAAVRSQLVTLLGSLTTAGLTLLFTVFLLVQYQDMRDRIVKIAGTDNMSLTVAALNDAGSRLSQLFLAQALLNTGFGIFTGVALTIIGVPNAPLWAIATALLRFVPYIGGILAAIPPIILAAAVDPGWTMMIATTLVFAVGEPLMAHIVEPLVLGKRSGLSPLALIVAASFWTLVWGPIGLVLAAPLTMTIVVLGQYLPRFEFVTVLLGDAPPLSPSEEFYHRLLSSDAAAAYDQLMGDAENGSLSTTCDRIAIPALRQAARDLKAARLDEEQMEELRTTVIDLSDLVADEIASNRLQAGKGAPVRDADDKASPIVLLPARGAVDEIAARFIADLLSARLDAQVKAIERASGLMGVQTVRQMSGDKAPRCAVIISLGDPDLSFVGHIARRLQRELPDTSVVTFTPGASRNNIKRDAESLTPELVMPCQTMRELTEVIERSLGRDDDKAVAAQRANRLPAGETRRPAA